MNVRAGGAIQRFDIEYADGGSRKWRWGIEDVETLRSFERRDYDGDGKADPLRPDDERRIEKSARSNRAHNQLHWVMVWFGTFAYITTALGALLLADAALAAKSGGMRSVAASGAAICMAALARFVWLGVLTKGLFDG